VNNKRAFIGKRDVDTAMRKRKGKEPDPEIEQLKQALKDHRRGSTDKSGQTLIRIGIRIIEVNRNLKEIIRLLKVKH
jgi:hypothetical protein